MTNDNSKKCAVPLNGGEVTENLSIIGAALELTSPDCLACLEGGGFISIINYVFYKSIVSTL
jgi:hypothetical protein